MDKYNQEASAWYDFEANCDDWYMDSCHFWDDNHFHLLFDDSTPPHVEHILESKQEPCMHFILQVFYSPVVVDDFFGCFYIFGSTRLVSIFGACFLAGY
jgi:hypothetical protein